MLFCLGRIDASICRIIRQLVHLISEPFVCRNQQPLFKQG
nr:MAG TPA: hypothetical protein [Caudoviricetes sp.]